MMMGFLGQSTFLPGSLRFSQKKWISPRRPALRMAVSIPYDSSLVLGELVSMDKLAELKELGKKLAPIEEAENKLNHLIVTKVSLSSSLKEAQALGIDTDSIDQRMSTIDEGVKEALETLIAAKLTLYSEGDPSATSEGSIEYSYRSPVDFSRTQIKHLPLSYDSINLDSQYFSFDKTEQEQKAAVQSMKGFVASSFSFLGNKVSSQMSAASARSASQQLDNHSVLGTLVITAACTHQNARRLEPLVYHPDEAVQVFNRIFPTEKMAELSQKAMQDILIEAEVKGSEANSGNTLNILSGVTLGSSFVGMVHILKNESTQSSQDIASVSSKIEATMKRGAWFSSMSGGFGVENTFARDVKSLLSTQELSSHCTIVSSGCIPSIKSNQVQIGVKQFADFNPAAMEKHLATLANSTIGDVGTLDSSAEAARTGGRMMAIRSGEIQSVMTGLEKVDDGANMVLDVNSLMTAFEDYTEKAMNGETGVPINFFVTEITKTDIAFEWLKQYYPDGIRPGSPAKEEGN